MFKGKDFNCMHLHPMVINSSDSRANVKLMHFVSEQAPICLLSTVLCCGIKVDCVTKVDWFTNAFWFANVSSSKSVLASVPAMNA